MRIEKKYIVKELNERYSSSSLMVITSYQGLVSNKIDELRTKVSGANANINVIPNRLLKRALPADVSEKFVEALSGANAIATTSGDVVELSKALKEFADENKGFEIKAGLLELKNFLNNADIIDLASLPPKQVLQAQLVCALQGPIRKFAVLFNTMLSNAVRVIDQIAEKKGGSATENE